MPVHVDIPAPGMAFDPRRFTVRGWLWLEERHRELAAVEVWSEQTPLGECAEFHARADVNAKYHVPEGMRTGFELVAHHPTATAGQRFILNLRGRFRDGTTTAVLFTSRLGPLPLETDPREMLRVRLKTGALGLEIGAHTRPTPGLTPFYTDSVSDFVGAAGRADFLSDARALPLPDDVLDYVCSSHVLEHLADPIGALHEWHRVLRPGGMLYLVVPDKRYTFDQPRAVTSPEHVLRDFQESGRAAEDTRHVDEFVDQTNWDVLHPDVPPERLASHRSSARADYLRDLARGVAIDIHYHTFTPDSLDAVLAAAGFTGGDAPRFSVIARAERYPPGRDDGIALLLAKTGSSADRASSPCTFTLSRADDDRSALPLVCPISLGALTLETDTDGARSLAVAGTERRFSFRDNRPVLLPAAGEAPQRAWGNRGWRGAGAGAVISGALPAAAFSRSHVDEPTPGTSVDPLGFFVRGWVWLGPHQPTLASVEAWSGDTLIGQTRTRYVRPDVCAAHGLPADARTGFELFAHHAGAPAGGHFEIEIRARLADGTLTPVVSSLGATTIARDYRTNHFGVLLDQRTTAIQRRENIFAVGPSQAEGSGELAGLIRRHLGRPPQRIIDVGCGLGSYGRGLLADGYDWMGAEISPQDCAELARVGLPHRQTDGRTLPFEAASFDAALCIEVLEHIAEPRPFLAEIKRVAPRRLIVSVPNCELLGYLYDHLATPWHMLEATHTNFFTRWSLGALLREFYPDVELGFHTPYPLRTVEGTPLHYNLLAIATTSA